MNTQTDPGQSVQAHPGRPSELPARFAPQAILVLGGIAAARALAPPMIVASHSWGGVASGLWIAAALDVLFALGVAYVLARLVQTVLFVCEENLRVVRYSDPSSSRSSELSNYSGAPAVDPRSILLADLRKEIAGHRWSNAANLVETFVSEYPDAPEAPALATELASARQEASGQARARLDDARTADDAELVIALCDQLAKHLDVEPLRVLERDVMQWLLRWIQKRLRDGRIDIDLVDLANQAAERFAATPEAASLRSALPTLRRSAGLCPRCGQPFLGLADVCPICRTAMRKQESIDQAAPSAPLDPETNAQPHESDDIDTLVNQDQSEERLWKLDEPDAIG